MELHDGTALNARVDDFGTARVAPDGKALQGRRGFLEGRLAVEAAGVRLSALESEVLLDEFRRRAWFKRTRQTHEFTQKLLEIRRVQA